MSSVEYVWDEKRRRWVEKSEYEAKRRVMEALAELLEDAEIELEIDLKTGKAKGRIRITGVSGGMFGYTGAGAAESTPSRSTLLIRRILRLFRLSR